MPVLGSPALPWTLKVRSGAVPVRLPILPVGRVFTTRVGVRVVNPATDELGSEIVVVEAVIDGRPVPLALRAYTRN